MFTHKLSSIEYYIVRRQEFLACLFKIFEGSEIYVYIGWIGHYCDKTKKAAEKIIGFPAYVVHTPSALNQGGCSYSVRVDDRALNEIRKIAGDNEIPIRRIYIERTVNGERVYDVVS